MSFSDIAGTETFIPGSEMPLLLETVPPSTTGSTRRCPSTSVTVSPNRPSSTSSRSPGRASPARPW